ncbi:MAG: hypothetical protein LWX51_18020 [Deltaproteobacteria bacterium]|nr:hypothetical protein [Deltaproteobacteria bacterium]
MVFDSKKDVIPKSIQLIAGRTGREYNLRKNRKGSIQNPKQRYSLINRQKLIDLNSDQLKIYHRQGVEDCLKNGSNIRDTKWTESIAVGDKEFVLKTQTNLGAKAIGRNVIKRNGIYELRESQTPYGHVFDPEKCALSQKNSYFWNLSFDNTGR